ncbi:MAG: hypothetical protein CM15mP74_09650 [Halieaceae bacterium]|nr:MAG: hypothetical protein CM15mP74_09650 [Halieaceae bacterium]
MASFLSATNTRPMDMAVAGNSACVALEVYAAVRAAVGDDYAVGCRFLSDEIISAEVISTTPVLCHRICPRGDGFLSLSRGGKFDDAKQPKVGWAAYPYTGRSGYECMPATCQTSRGLGVAIPSP